ncbi:MAG TPA: thioredoxin family protein [Geminicoccus sp.]|uniref:thioredoxin family protein n=1 Tax=Geminicoccus sp. TaxID=2024832 RepID=UPI002E35F9ED|nr:thioredoxin family protein [Geminicoccus sp.]HEX2527304.1 thioredoxin family protein [Geminicoccus sp.]
MPSLTTPPGELGFAAPPFTLRDVDGRAKSLAELAGQNGTLVAFICNHCPYVKAIVDRMVRDAGDLAKIGISTVAICSNDGKRYPDDDFPSMQRFAKEHGFTFPYLHDESQEVARAYGAVCTPDFFGFDGKLALRYRGRLDSSGRQAGAPDAKRELYLAMKQVAETGEALAEQIPSMGCSIKWRED